MKKKASRKEGYGVMGVTILKKVVQGGLTEQLTIVQT